MEREEGQQSSPEERRSPESEGRSPESEGQQSSPGSETSISSRSPPTSDDSSTNGNSSSSNGSDSGSPLPVSGCSSSPSAKTQKHHNIGNKRGRNGPSCPKEMVHNWRLKPQNIVEITLMQPDDFSKKARDNSKKTSISLSSVNNIKTTTTPQEKKPIKQMEESYNFHMVNPNNKIASHAKRANNEIFANVNSIVNNDLNTPPTPKEGRDEKRSRPSNPPVDGEREQVQKISQSNQRTSTLDKHRHNHTHSHTHNHTHNHSHTHTHTHHHVHNNSPSPSPSPLLPPPSLSSTSKSEYPLYTSNPTSHAQAFNAPPSLNSGLGRPEDHSTGAALLEHFRRSFETSHEEFVKDRTAADSRRNSQGKMSINNLIDST